MARWHDSSCTSPDIILDDGLPLCRTCERKCLSLDDLRSKQGPPPTLVIPPDEPADQRNLWWPTSVRYVNEDGSEATIDPENKISSSLDKGRTYASPIYGRTLGADEFRLACLSAASDPSCPVHLDLEVYTHEDRPEYETVSYLWGGEDNDSSLSSPVFIRPFWDVLLQTQNCSSMLRFVRPWRGMRMMWIDAVCINQENVVERGAQVTKMRQIYEESTRVIVYLGDDIVTKSRRFPTYRLLSDMATPQLGSTMFPLGHRFCEDEIDLARILQRRYFQRIWVIQELIACERAVVRVGDVDYRPGASTREWDQTWAPWVRYLGSAKIPANSAIKLVQLFSKSRASDPRDRIFGIVSLLENQTLAAQLRPDYSLSFNHFAIGLLAHLLVNERWYQLLLRAGIWTREFPSDSSSWLPDCASSESWHRLFQDRASSELAQISILSFI
ncbi:hypothetical protein K491DRAFT_581180, partial [Lophiostoma macrostomum CBS 122681]